MEFSEDRYLGIAPFSWVQLLVWLPVLFMIEKDNRTAKHFLLMG
jgi:hypothetical protein